MKSLRLSIPILVFFLITGGCSGNGANPVIDDFLLSSDSSLIFNDGLPIIEATNIGNSVFDALGVLGGYELTISLESMTAELASMRNGAIGESYIVNGISYFTISPCADCLKIKSIALTADYLIQVAFMINHPFKPGDVLKPPTAVNRLDLDVFDLALLVHPIDETPEIFTLTDKSVYTGVLVDNSGYTTELANAIDDQSAIPYVLVVDDNADTTDTFNKFRMGAEVEFDVLFSPGENLYFNLYLTMGYGASAKKAQRLFPTYYNPEFNRKSAWKVVVSPPNGYDPPVIGNTWNDSDNSTLFDVTVRVFDWQIGANVDPELTNTDDVFAASEVTGVSLEIPGMNESLISTTIEDSGTGTPADPLVYTLSAANENLITAGEYFGLVKVSDSRIPGESLVGGETDTLADTPDGISLRWLNIPEFATYQTFPATVVIGCGPITGSITAPVCPISGVTSGSSINFEASASSDNDGDPVVLYEWDIDYDGLTFDVDASGETALLGPFINPNCGTPPEDPVTYTVAVRGTDSCTPSNITVFDTCEVTVDICETPSIGNITLTVNRLDLAGKYAIDDSSPFTLEWEDPGAGYVEYAIYIDIDPSDGLTNDLVFVGTTTGLTFTDDITTIPVNHYIEGWTYIVRGRTQAGNQSSEGPASEPAYVTINSWETLSQFQNPGIGNDGEGWLVNHETNTTVSFSFPRAYNEYPSYSNYSCLLSPLCNSYYMQWAGRWNGLIKEVPAVPDSEVRMLDTVAFHFQDWDESGLVLGTSPSRTEHNFDVGLIDWAYSNDSGEYTTYNFDSNMNQTWLEDVPDGINNSWHYERDRTTTPYALYGGDVNNGGDASDAFVAIEFLHIEGTNLNSQAYIYLDEISIAIY